MNRAWLLLLCGMVGLSACSFGLQRTTRLDAETPVAIWIVDESGAPVPSARYDYGGGSQESDPQGRVELAINGPVSGLVTAPGMLPEPVVVSPRDTDIQITLLALVGPNGPA